MSLCYCHLGTVFVISEDRDSWSNHCSICLVTYVQSAFRLSAVCLKITPRTPSVVIFHRLI